jgi:hypothetical protein
MKKIISINLMVAILLVSIVLCSSRENPESYKNHGGNMKGNQNDVETLMMNNLDNSISTEVNYSVIEAAEEPVKISSSTFQVSVLRDGSFSLVDKISGTKYEPDPWGDGAGAISFDGFAQRTVQTQNPSQMDRTTRTAGMAQGRSQMLSLSGADKITRTIKGHAIEISFIWEQGIAVHTRLTLDGDAFMVSVENVVLPEGSRLGQIVYPSRFASLTTGENGYLIIPSGPGAIIPSHLYTVIGGEFWRMDDSYRQKNQSGIFLPFFSMSLGFNFSGVQRGSSGLTFICDDPFDAGILIFANTRGNRYAYTDGKWSIKDPIAAISSVWQSSLGRFGYRRQLTIRRHGQTGYVESAAIYRRWLDEHGWSRTLKDKIRQNPEREKLIGSTQIDIYGGYPHYAPDSPKILDFSFDQITSLVDTIDRELKLDRVSIAVWGTFENFPPNCWPINKKRGGVEGWKRTVDRAKKAGYLITGYHSYMPQEEHDPLFDPRLIFQTSPDLSDPLRRAFSIGRWGRTCTSLSMGYAKKNLPLELAATGQNADFIDIMGVFSGNECYDTVNHNHNKPITRKEEIAYRQNLFSYIHDDLNLPNWTENGSAAYLKVVDCFGGLASVQDVLRETSIPVPLAALVAHDMVVLRQHNGDNYRDGRGQFAKRTLYDILGGNSPIHMLQAWEFEGRKQDMVSFHNILARIHRKVGLEKMIDHQFLPGPSLYDTGTYLVQKTVFSDRTKIYVNLGLNPFKSTEVDLPAYGYEVRLAGGEVMKGSVQSDLISR